MGDEAVVVDARALCSGKYSAWLKKVKHEGARGKWLSSTNKRFFTIDFDAKVVFYSHSADQKKVSQPIKFKEIVGAERLPPSKKRKGCGIVLTTTDKSYELICATNPDAVQWVHAFNAAREIATARAEAEEEQKNATALHDQAETFQNHNQNATAAFEELDAAQTTIGVPPEEEPAKTEIALEQQKRAVRPKALPSLMASPEKAVTQENASLSVQREEEEPQLLQQQTQQLPQQLEPDQQGQPVQQSATETTAAAEASTVHLTADDEAADGKRRAEEEAARQAEDEEAIKQAAAAIAEAQERLRVKAEEATKAESEKEQEELLVAEAAAREEERRRTLKEAKIAKARAKARDEKRKAAVAAAAVEAEAKRVAAAEAAEAKKIADDERLQAEKEASAAKAKVRQEKRKAALAEAKRKLAQNKAAQEVEMDGFLVVKQPKTLKALPPLVFTGQKDSHPQSVDDAKGDSSGLDKANAPCDQDASFSLDDSVSAPAADSAEVNISGSLDVSLDSQCANDRRLEMARDLGLGEEIDSIKHSLKNEESLDRGSDDDSAGLPQPAAKSPGPQVDQHLDPSGWDSDDDALNSTGQKQHLVATSANRSGASETRASETPSPKKRLSVSFKDTPEEFPVTVNEHEHHDWDADEDHTLEGALPADMTNLLKECEGSDEDSSEDEAEPVTLSSKSKEATSASGWDSDDDDNDVEISQPPSMDACGAPERGVSAFVERRPESKVIALSATKPPSATDGLDDLLGLVLGADTTTTTPAPFKGADSYGFVPGLHCTGCDFQVMRIESYTWNKDAAYMAFRNNYPNVMKLRKFLTRQNECCAFCCQCSWKSADAKADISDVIEGLRWKVISA